MLNITIDGHVGSGKSTLAKGIANKLSLNVFDTGAVYRSLACAYIERFGKIVNQKNVELLSKAINIEVIFDKKVQHVLVDNKDYGDKIRSEEISVFTSKISPFKALREKVLFIQRNFASENDCVMEGRDIGTDVLPNANVKFFITASETVRAQRRFDQIKDKPNAPSFEEILQDLRVRDYADEHRDIAPLKPANDAIIMDTSNYTLDETIEKCIEIINLKTKNKLS